MSSATARVSSILPSKRRYEPFSVRLVGTRRSISTAMWRITIGDIGVRGRVRGRVRGHEHPSLASIPLYIGVSAYQSEG